MLMNDSRKTPVPRMQNMARQPSFARPRLRPAGLGPDLFRAACDMGLEGIVSKRRDRPHQSGRSKHWLKTKNRKHPAIAADEVLALQWLAMDL
jgi:bifunctional non-homologous end joining protein LigD